MSIVKLIFIARCLFGGGSVFWQMFTPEGFTSLLALVSRNGQGIGTSPLADWVASVEKEKESLDEARQKEVDDLIDQIYDKIDEGAALLPSLI
jgi:hypothetical protein